MIIVTKSGEKILFDKLEDLRNYVDNNILEALQEYTNKLNQQDDYDIDYYKGEVDDLEEELEETNYVVSESFSKVEDLLDSIDNDIENKEDLNKILDFVIFELNNIKNFLKD